MNKRELVDAISDRLGSKKAAAEAVDAILETIQTAVAKGDKVAITGFGSFEKADRPARTARNPATGKTIEVPATSVPKSKAGADFKHLVAGKKQASPRQRPGPSPHGPGRRRVPGPSGSPGSSPCPGPARGGPQAGTSRPGTRPRRAPAGAVVSPGTGSGRSTASRPR